MLITENCFAEEFTQQDTENTVKIYTNQQTRKFLGGALSRHEAEKKSGGAFKQK